MASEIVRESVAQQITRQIRNQIQSGQLRHGQLLPSNREWAAEWKVSTKTMQAAVAPLIDEGLVIARNRAGRAINAPEQLAAPAVAKPVRPQVVLAGGYAGSGKTEFGRIVVRQTGWGMFDKDTITRDVVEAALEALGKPASDRESDTYLKVIRPAEYKALVAAIMENIECGASVVATAPFIRELSDLEWLDKLKGKCEERGAALNVVWVACDAESMRGYIRQRDARRDDWKLANWDAYLSSIDPDFRPDFPHSVVDNSQNYGQTLEEQVKRFISDLTGAAQ